MARHSSNLMNVLRPNQESGDTTVLDPCIQTVRYSSLVILELLTLLTFPHSPCSRLGLVPEVDVVLEHGEAAVGLPVAHPEVAGETEHTDEHEGVHAQAEVDAGRVAD